MRDNRKDENYFREFKKTETKRIDNFESNLAANKVVDKNIGLVKKVISTIKFDLLVAGYSDGTKIEELQKGFIDFIQTVHVNWPYAWYSETMWILSWGILLDIDNNMMASFLQEVEKEYHDDWLMSFLLAYKVEGYKNNAEKVRFKKPYQAVKDIIEKGNNKENKLAEYLQTKWYNQNTEAGWYDTHKSKENTYSGYWSFETAAIVKILDLDAGKLAGVEYYPEDLYL